MQIKKVAVLGAGAVGSYVIWGLSQAENLSLGVIAEGERAGRLKENGCLINGQVYRPEVWTPKEAHGADLLIVSLKYGALPGRIGQHCAGGGRTHNRNEFNERCRQRRNYCAESESR